MKTIKIGRNPDSDIVIEDKTLTVSGNHASLKVYDNGTISIYDSSTNGTFINGVKATKGIDITIKKGDEVRLGPHERLNWSLVEIPSTQTDSTRMGNDSTRIENDEKENYTIGTERDNRIVVSDASNHVSRHHAVLKLRQDGRFYIYDQSTNGTYVNGVKIKSKIDFLVSPSDNISFANVMQFNWSLVGVSKPNPFNYTSNPTPPPRPQAAQQKSQPTQVQEMFSDPFSFDGRIRRTELFLSSIMYGVISFIVNLIGATGGSAGMIYLVYIPMLWFFTAQSAKRCHDRGNSGWYQLIPFYGLWLLFGDSDTGTNEYGNNPKGIN